VCHSLDAIIAGVLALAQPDMQVVIMSNGGFGGIHMQLIEALEAMQ
jgi:UDP-N-acetylmuramate: L-alanyl-gamma-D-glutamyl-meso-diaminopimelate ligase